MTECGNSGCHSDANPPTFTTAGESVLPPYYFTPDAVHPQKPTNSCNFGGSEGAIAPPWGLDNDGNNAYDSLDPLWAPTPTRPSSWGRLKTLYR